MEEQTAPSVIFDVDEVEFSKEHLALFYRQMRKFECEDIFKAVWNQRNKEGLMPSQVTDYDARRRHIDRSLAVLEFAGFIENRPFGRTNHYFPTVRGVQYANYLLLKRKESENA